MGVILMIYDKSNIKEQVNFILRELGASIDALYTAPNLLTITQILENMRVDVQNLVYLNEIRDKQKPQKLASEDKMTSEDSKELMKEEANQHKNITSTSKTDLQNIDGVESHEREEIVESDKKTENQHEETELDRLVAELLADSEEDEDKEKNNK